MAKKPRDPDAELVPVTLACGFRHKGVYKRAGETILLTRKDARDMLALHMIRLPPQEAA